LTGVVNKLLRLGVSESQPEHEQRLIRTVNFLNLVVALGLAAGFTNYFILGSDFPFPAVSSFFTLAILSLFLSRFGHTRSAFLLFTLNVNLSVFFISEYYPSGAGAYLYYYPLIVSIVLLNNPSIRDKLSIIHIAVCGLFFAGTLWLEFPALRVNTLDEGQVKMLWYYNVIISTVITAILSLLLTRVITRQNREIMAQNSDLLATREVVNASLKEKEVLLAELHHRVKNNLAIISGLLNLQEDATENEEVRRIIGESRTRIMSMAMVHSLLYENQDLKRISLDKYAARLISELFNSYSLLRTVDIREDYDDVVLTVGKSIPLGLILNEIVTNSIKYAYRAMPKGGGLFEISIRKTDDGRIRVTLKDNGVGFSEDYDALSSNRSLGIYLIRTLTVQLEGEVRFLNEGGAKVELVFPA
jgi:two-component sensor histidine kinase